MATDDAGKGERLAAPALIGVGGCIGSFAGVLFTTMDLLSHGRRLTAVEASQLFGIFILVGVVAGIGASVLIVPISRRVLRGLPDAAFLCAILGAGVQIVLTVLLSGATLLVTTLLPWALAAGVYTASRRTSMVGVAKAGLFASLGGALGISTVCPLISGGVGGTALALVVALLAGGVIAWVGKKKVFIAVGVLIIVLAVEYLVVGTTPSWDQVAPVASMDSKDLRTSPNVVLIVLDTTRRDHLGCYGDTRGLTPRLDEFAKEGVVYSEMISPASWTLPSHASIFSGYYPISHGCGNEHHRWLDGGFETLAEMLSKENYQTVSVTNNHYLEPSNLLQGFQSQVNPWRRREPLKASRWMMAAGFPTGWADHGVVDSVSALSAWLSNDRDSSRPFFLFVNLMEAHWPHFPPRTHRAKWLPDDVGYVGATLTSSRFYGVLWMAGKPRTRRDESTIRGLYAASVAYQDVQLGGLLDVLGDEVDLDNTLVMITADHGEGLGEGGRWDHVFALSDALIHVPMIIRYPPNFPAGRRLEGGCQLVDIVPTVFDVLGRPCPVDDLPGQSLVPGRFTPREETFAQTSPYYGHLERMEAVTGFNRDVMGFTAHLRAIRTSRYKFVWSSRGDHRLYDLTADPDELTNIAKQVPDVAEDFESKVVRWWTGQQPYTVRPDKDESSISDDSLESLRSLGYVGD